MRPVTQALLVLLWVVFPLIQLRYHIRALGQLLNTYGSFHPYLQQHPEVLYRYPGDDASSDSKLDHSLMEEDSLVPRLIHQISLTNGDSSTLDQFASAIQSCRRLHPRWNHTIWTDDTAREFMWLHYPALYPTYIGYRQTIQRADLVRLAILDHFGGVYLDLDITCRQPLESLRHIPFLTPAAHPAGINNAFILSRPHHPFLTHVLEAAPSRNLYWGLPYLQTMLTAGCGFLGNMWMSYAATAAVGIGDPFSDGVYILGDEFGETEPHMLRGTVITPLFKHEGASSWHSWDGAIIVAMGKYCSYVSPKIWIIVLLVMCAGWEWRKGSRWVFWKRSTQGEVSDQEWKGDLVTDADKAGESV